MKKILSLIVSMIIIVSIFITNAYSEEGQSPAIGMSSIISKSQHPSGGSKLYHGYNEMIYINDEIHVGIRIKDGVGLDGKDNIVYCYDQSKSFPTSENAQYVESDGKWIDDRCLYSRTENYLEADDPYINAYGKEKKQKIALALYIGYPNDAYGIYEYEYKDKLTSDEARKMTQNLLWDITSGNLGEYTPSGYFTQNMCDYYNSLYNRFIKNFVEGSEFFPSNPEIKGNLTLSKNGDRWYSSPMYLNGISGTYCDIILTTSDTEMAVYHYPSGEIANFFNPIKVGEKFFLSTTNKPNDLFLRIDWFSESAKFYFYKHEKGGKGAKGGENNIQNLIRVEPSINKGNANYILKEDGSTQRVDDSLIKIPVKKEWKGNLPREEIKVWILSNGNKLFYKTLNEKNNWSVEFDVPRIDSNDNVINYTVIEDPVPNGWTSQITGDKENGFIITNYEIIDFEEDTTPEGEHGSLPDGTITEEEEEWGQNEGDIDFEEDTTPEGEHGSLPDGTITETEEDSYPPQPEESKPTPEPTPQPDESKPTPQPTPQPGENNPVPQPGENNPAPQPEAVDTWENIPDTSDESRLIRYTVLAILSIVLLVLFNIRKKERKGYEKEKQNI